MTRRCRQPRAFHALTKAARPADWCRADSCSCAFSSDPPNRPGCNFRRIVRKVGNDKPALVLHRGRCVQATARKLLAYGVLERRSAWGTGGGLGHITLVESDFDRLWEGVSRGDALGTAWSVLRFLGPGAEQFIGRERDFIFGWTNDEDAQYGNLLLLQVIPRPHLLPVMN